jgi:hypothetical protein
MSDDMVCHTVMIGFDELDALRSRIAALEAVNARQVTRALEFGNELVALRSENARLRSEMKRYLPVLEAMESNHSGWEWYTAGTGIATLNGYRAALEPKP